MSRFPWHNQFPIDPAAVATALDADIPELAGAHVEPLGEGWDFAAFLVGGEWVLRFPKRRSSARALTKEIRTLAAIHTTLGQRAARVPRYRWVVEQPKTFALPYAGYRYLEGCSLIYATPDPATVQRVAHAVGSLLKDVHALTAFTRPRRFNDQFSGHIAEFRYQLERLHDVLPRPLVESSRALLATTLPRYTGPPRFCHADLLVEHILVSPTDLAVIDWADASWDDPWSDFVGLWSWAGDAAVHAAVETYGTSPGNDDWHRIRYKGISVCIGQVYYGHFDAQSDLLAESIRSLERMMRSGQIDDPTRPDD